MKNRLLGLTAVCLASVALAGAPALAQSKTGTVRIGVNESLSGDYSVVGLPPAAAIRMAAKEINDAGGFVVGDTTYTLEIVETDNQSQPASAIAGVTKLVEDEGIKFVFGPTQSAMAIQTTEITVPADVIHISAASLWQARGLLSDPEKPLLFGTQNQISLLNDVDLTALNELGVKKIALITQDDETSKSHTNSFVPALEAAGIGVELIMFPTNTADLTSYVSRAKAAGADLIWYFFPQARVSEVLRTTLDLDAAKMFGGRAISPKAAVSDAIGGPVPIPYYSSFSSPSLDYPPNDKVAAFKERLTAFDPAAAASPVVSFAFFTYDFVPMLVEAMKTAGTVEDTAAIGEALRNTTYDGVIGKICYNGEMQTAASDGGLIFVRNGEIDSRTYPSKCQ